MKIVNVPGDVSFSGFLLLAAHSGDGRHGIFICFCGTIKEMFINNVMRPGGSISCGCMKKGLISAKKKRHGLSFCSEYGVWAEMRRRCKDKNRKDFHGYGGRGISVCKRWNKFENFYKDMGPRPAGFTIERINNDSDYKPSNCRWAPWKDQYKNKNNLRLITYLGITNSLAEWSRLSGISRSLLKSRLGRRLPLRSVFKEYVP